MADTNIYYLHTNLYVLHDHPLSEHLVAGSSFHLMFGVLLR